jgi:CheY-like chemotaxis protein
LVTARWEGMVLSAESSILVVDDDADVRELSALFLRELGYTVIEAPNGKAALAELHSHPEIVLLFTDIVMPEVDGVLLAERARALRPDIRVVYATGFAEKVRSLRGQPLYGPVLQKPWRGLQLAQAIEGELKASG